MEQTKSRLLTVEFRFSANGQYDLTVLPRIPIGSYSGPPGRVVLLRRPDRTETIAYAELIKPLVIPPAEPYYLCVFHSLTINDLPIGTEIWLIRSDLQDEFWYAILKRSPIPIREVEALVQAGADVNDAGSTGWTPLLNATEFRNVDLARLLLDRGADVNRAEEGGWTPLHNAVDASLVDYPAPGDEPTELIMLLLERGASVSAPDFRGWTPLDVASAYRSKKVVDLLKSWQEHLRSQQGAAPSAGSADVLPKSVS